MICSPFPLSLARLLNTTLWFSSWTFNYLLGRMSWSNQYWKMKNVYLHLRGRKSDKAKEYTHKIPKTVNGKKKFVLTHYFFLLHYCFSLFLRLKNLTQDEMRWDGMSEGIFLMSDLHFRLMITARHYWKRFKWINIAWRRSSFFSIILFVMSLLINYLIKKQYLISIVNPCR
jgi:hypothetical protein